MRQAVLPKVVHWSALSDREKKLLLQRPTAGSAQALRTEVKAIISAVRQGGDQALRKLTRRFDGIELDSLEVQREDWPALASLVPELRSALYEAAVRIERFHSTQIPTPCRLETWPGVVCAVDYRPFERVGLYIPGGSAPLISTLLMLVIPARLAGVREIIVCTPSGPGGQIAPEILATAREFGVSRVFQLGGAQAITALAYGTETVARCAKIFGPGNRWVTEAKRQVAADPDGAAIDLPAGPSEVLVLADGDANARFIAADLLAQAEHGADSQVILITDDAALAKKVGFEIAALLPLLARHKTFKAALANARLIVVPDLATGIEVSNVYAPEHLILHLADAERWLVQVTAAGSVFLGSWTPETLGDYSSGTNHVLPTGGYARWLGGLTVGDFMRRMTSQSATRQGLVNAGSAAMVLAAAEGLDAHRLAVAVRLKRA